MENTIDSVAITSDREIVTTRVLNAPRELVYKAWTDPTHVAKWWGPSGFTNTIQEMDVKPGGVWRFMMHGPNGINFPNKIVFIEVIEPELLVYKHSGEGDDDIVFHVRVTFVADGNKTKLTMHSVFETAAMLKKATEEYHAIEGAQQHVAKLAAYLDTMPTDDDLVIIREFNAPRQLVYDAWTTAAYLAKWWGPAGGAIEVKKFDLRPGGVFHYAMLHPDLGKVWGKFTYREITAPELIIFTSSFSDEEGAITPMLWMPVWPLEILNILSLTEHDGKTRLSLGGRPINASAEEIAAYKEMLKSMQQGFNGTFEKLETFLAEMVK